MKKTIFIFLALLISTFSIAQKKELIAVEEALKNGKIIEAKKTLLNISSVTQNTNIESKALYYFLKGKTYQQLSEKETDNEAYLEISGEAYNKLLDLEREYKEFNFINQARQNLKTVISKLVDKAIIAQQGKDYNKASNILYTSYTLKPENKDFLYFAASNSLTGKDYDKALKYYEELQANNYTGQKTLYYAKNVSTGKIELFQDKEVRDLSIRSNTHVNGSEKQSQSRLPEIVKNISWIYANYSNNYYKALAAVEEAIKISPEDTSLLLTKGNIYYKMGDMTMFKETMKEIVKINPNDVNAYYNIGVVSAENGDIQEARDSYKKALDLDPKYINARINLSKTYMDEASNIADKMNNLGNSFAEKQKIEEYQKQQIDLYRKSAEILEKAIEIDPKKVEVLKQLKGLYAFLEEEDKLQMVEMKLADLGQ